MKMLNLSMFKLIKHLTEKSKDLRWGTEYLFFFLLTSPQAPIIIIFYHGGGGGGFGGSHDFQGDWGERIHENIAEPWLRGGGVYFHRATTKILPPSLHRQ